MSTPSRQLKIAYSDWPVGRHASGWRLPEAFNGGVADPAYLVDAVRTAERGLFDYFFVGNAISSTASAQERWLNDVFKIEGFTAAAYAAAVSSHIGLVVTVNTSYADPFDTTRALVSLDHLSRGRAGLNIVTGAAGVDSPAHNYGADRHLSEADKYDRAEEFVAIVQQLSDSWESDWKVDDRERGLFVDPDKGHAINFKGRHFSVAGPLNLPRPPQGQIPIVHAGGSDRSFHFGARHADIRFSPFVDPDWNQAYYRRVKGLLAQYGRQEDEQLVIPGLTLYVGGTRQEAQAKFRQVQDLVVTQYAPQRLTAVLGRDLSQVPARERVLKVLDEDTLNEHRWIAVALDAFGDRELVTLEDLFHYVANTAHLNQPPVVGSPKDIARWLAEAFEARALDGFKLFPPYSRQPLQAVVDHVVPELQRLGIYKTAYQASTLRGHLGLAVPPNRHAVRASAGVNRAEAA